MDNKKNSNSNDKLERAKKIAEHSSNISSLFDDISGFIFRIFRWFSSLIDKLFFSSKYMVLFAFFLACLMYLLVNFNSESIKSVLSSSKTISSVPVSVRYNSESFEVSGVPLTCDVIITGDAANVNSAANRSGYCMINLEGYTEGQHLVDIVPTGFGDNVSAIANPSKAQITLKRKTTAQFDISYDFINLNDLNSRYILGIPQFDIVNGKVNIRASQDTLDSIALVKALIDVSGKTEDFEIDAPLAAYNAKGQLVDAEIVPNTVKATIKVSSPHKTVPILLNISGEAPTGYSLDSVVMDHQSTEIYASEAILAGINEVTVNLDLSAISGDADIVQPVVLPAGVSAADVTMVNIKATLSESVTKELNNVPIVYRNNINSLVASQVSTTQATVTVTGTANTIQSVSASDIVVFVDVKDLEAGTYDLPLQIQKVSNTYCSFVADPSFINITLTSQE